MKTRSLSDRACRLLALCQSARRLCCNIGRGRGGFGFLQGEGRADLRAKLRYVPRRARPAFGTRPARRGAILKGGSRGPTVVPGDAGKSPALSINRAQRRTGDADGDGQAR